MTQFEFYGLVIFFIGYIIGQFVSAEVGKVVAVVGAAVFVLAYLLTVIH